MNKKLIVGSWKLESWELKHEVGKWLPWASDSAGILIYTADDYMSVSLNKNFSGESQTIDDCLFYAGRFSIDGDQITHQVMNATDYSNIGRDLVRNATLENNKLTLTGIAKSGKPFKLVWVRV